MVQNPCDGPTWPLHHLSPGSGPQKSLIHKPTINWGKKSMGNSICRFLVSFSSLSWVPWPDNNFLYIPLSLSCYLPFLLFGPCLCLVAWSSMKQWPSWAGWHCMVTTNSVSRGKLEIRAGRGSMHSLPHSPQWDQPSHPCSAPLAVRGTSLGLPAFWPAPWYQNPILG